jgi:hypothetical protein
VKLVFHTQAVAVDTWVKGVKALPRDIDTLIGAVGVIGCAGAFVFEAIERVWG